MGMTGHNWREKSDAGTVEVVENPADDQKGFADQFEGCRSHLLKLCRRILGESEGARDAVNDTYLRAYQSRAGFDGGNFVGWLVRIAQHICIDRIRKEPPVQSIDAGIEPASMDSEIRILTAIQIRAILKKLPPPQRRCLMLFYIEGLTAKEVAQAAGFTENQVKSYIQNGRRTFMREWKALRRKADE
jgi:RNA polymerase sigma-70 factor (ECF subfamily)